jgi:sigma-B regulation protein RsbU (phosphoserine phosphatase)
MARHVLRAFCSEDPTPVEVLRRVNHALYYQMSEEAPFLTMVYGILDSRAGAFTYCNAGHPPPVLYEPGRDSWRELSATGGVVGAALDLSYAQESVVLAPGAVLALFTDGIGEARRGQEMLGSAGVGAVVKAHVSESVEAILEAILRRVREFAGGTVRDDIAVVVLRHD